MFPPARDRPCAWSLYVRSSRTELKLETGVNDPAQDLATIVRKGRARSEGPTPAITLLHYDELC